jgi:hypothetical protein
MHETIAAGTASGFGQVVAALSRYIIFGSFQSFNGSCLSSLVSRELPGNQITELRGSKQQTSSEISTIFIPKRCDLYRI